MKRRVIGAALCLLLGAGMLTGCSVSAPKVEPVEKMSSAQEPVAEATEAAVEETAPAEAQEAAPAEAAPAEVQEAAPAEAAPAETQEAAPAEAAPAEAQEAVPAEAVPAEAQEAVPAENLETAEEAAPAEEGQAQPEAAAPQETAVAEDQMISYLTGEPIAKEIGLQRPFAVMINNLDAAVPQSGVIYADMLYEMFVESDITRLMAVFQDPGDLEKIGPVRSCRHNFLSLADDNEAIYTHFGWSVVAEALINEQGRTTINGMFYDGGVGFYRTDDRVAPHNAYVTAQGLRDIAESLGISRSYPEGYVPNLYFNSADTPLAAGEDATYIQLAYPVNNPWFEFKPEDQLYYRFEYGGPHVDMETGEQLKFKNVIVQYADQSLIGDTPLLEIAVIGSGNGLYFTDGKVIPITWNKSGWEDRTHYYTADGQPLYLNPGKTMFQIIPEYYGVSYSTDQGMINTASQTEVEDTDWGGEG